MSYLTSKTENMKLKKDILDKILRYTYKK